MEKSTVNEIKERFDNDVERFANLETGQVATMDAQISLELLTSAAKAIKPKAVNVLDIGCGAGNYTLKMLSKVPNLNTALISYSDFNELLSTVVNSEVFFQKDVYLVKNHLDDIVLDVVCENDDLLIKIRKATYYNQIGTNVVLNIYNKAF